MSVNDNEDEFSQYLASNYKKNSDEDEFSKYLSSKFRKHEDSQEKIGALKKAANFADEHINQPIEEIGRGARNLAGGFAQGLLNIGPGLYNLGASGINALGGNLSKSPMFDFAPSDDINTKAGEIASFFAGPGALKTLGKIPELSHAVNSAMKLPIIAEGLKNASNILSKAPTATKIGGNALLGGAYSPDNPLLGMSLGGSSPLIGKLLSSPMNALGPIATNPSAVFTSKNAIKNTLLNKHDELEDSASKAFDYVSKEVENRDISKLPIIHERMTPGENISQEFIDSLREYLPKTRASDSIINKAANGEYSSLRKLQSDLYTRGKKNLGSDLEADRARGSEMLEKRQDINDAIARHLENSGHHDLSKILNKAKNEWSTLQNIYYNENMNNALVRMFDKGFRKIPKNLVDILSEDSIPMNSLLEYHPGIKNQIIGHQLGRNFLKKAGIPALLGGAGLSGYEFGKHG